MGTHRIVSQLFSTNRGVTVIPSTLPDPNGTVFWAISKNTANQYVFKVGQFGALFNRRVPDRLYRLLTLGMPRKSLHSRSPLQ